MAVILARGEDIEDAKEKTFTAYNNLTVEL